MRRLALILTATALITAGLTALPPSTPDQPTRFPMALLDLQTADAACSNRYVTRYAYRLADDDELNTYIRAFARIYYTDCGARETITAARIGFRPDKRHNQSLNCHGTVFHSLRMNLGHIGVNDPATRELPCYAGGNSRTINLTNVRNPSDRCAKTSMKVVKRKWLDRRLTPIGNVCVPG